MQPVDGASRPRLGTHWYRCLPFLLFLFFRLLCFLFSLILHTCTSPDWGKGDSVGISLLPLVIMVKFTAYNICCCFLFVCVFCFRVLMDTCFCCRLRKDHTRLLPACQACAAHSGSHHHRPAAAPPRRTYFVLHVCVFLRFLFLFFCCGVLFFFCIFFLILPFFFFFFTSLWPILTKETL